MASAITLDGPSPRRERRARGGGLGAVDNDGCRCSVRPNPKTGKRIRLCPVPKTKSHRSGWKIVGSCP
jgi:hypothetical protein